LFVVMFGTVGCERKNEPVVVVAPKGAVPVVVTPNGTVLPVVVVPGEHQKKSAHGVEVQTPVIVAYRETYVEGQPAPGLRVEVVPERPNPQATWIEGHWLHVRNAHEDVSGVAHGDQWEWVPGNWK
jgi:hypothetical protein